MIDGQNSWDGSNRSPTPKDRSCTSQDYIDTPVNPKSKPNSQALGGNFQSGFGLEANLVNAGLDSWEEKSSHKITSSSDIDQNGSEQISLQGEIDVDQNVDENLEYESETESDAELPHEKFE